MPTGLEGYREGTEQRRQPGTDTPQTTAYGSCIGQLINLPGWEALVITKAGPLWRGVSIALSETLTRMAAPSWGWPTATFLREGLRSRGPARSWKKSAPMRDACTLSSTDALSRTAEIARVRYGAFSESRPEARVFLCLFRPSLRY